uniref:MSP domain-containing protein n=1 Tax=Bursaphelenchus xylophilus TaxID=6326 RepID=A0A1I7RZZ1_BURXY
MCPTPRFFDNNTDTVHVHVQSFNSPPQRIRFKFQSPTGLETDERRVRKGSVLLKLSFDPTIFPGRYFQVLCNLWLCPYS